MINAFSFDYYIWDWIIAVYLFLAGMSAGMVMIAIYLKRKIIEGDIAKNGIIKATAILAPFGIIAGLTILIFHLSKPLHFWKLLFHFNTSSVMSMGTILFQVYMVVLFAWLAIIFTDLLKKLNIKLVDTVVEKLKSFENAIEITLVVLAVALAAYTGFLLSALKTYPMLNNPALPILFLLSSLSSGAAASLLFGMGYFKEPLNSPAVKWIHHFEAPVITFELFVLICFFSGLIFAGGQSEVAALAAITGGFWAGWFWIGVIAIGMLIPLTLNATIPMSSKNSRLYIIIGTICSLLGVLMLRTFILYAGQMTLV